jgi:photosystem II stability/assembly factor-like uncharacterized protein
MSQAGTGLGATRGRLRLLRRGRLLGLAALLGLAGCAGGQEAAREPGPVHVHGLGINPNDGALFIATHTGLFRVGPDEGRAARVGDSAQDTMGFTILGPDRFLGSGHPGSAEDGPPLLGLIASRDAGRSWAPVSLRGEADFHVLRSAGSRVYGFDVAGGRLLVSPNRGRTWEPRAAPAPLLDLVVDPARAGRIIASGEGGLYRSDDDGRTWTPVGRQIGYLAWPAPGTLYLLDGAGRVSRSTDGGSWRAVGEIGGEPAAFFAHEPRQLYAALHDGTIVHSGDGGTTWSVRSTP